MDETARSVRIIDRIGSVADIGDTAGRPGLLSPLVLAYIGDTVYDLFVRTYLISTTTHTAHGLHVKAAGYVCAASQARAYHAIADKLTEDETAVFKRGRNMHSATVPKNADVGDYRTATGLEALFGYLYLSGEDERLTQLMAMIFESANEGKAENNDSLR